MIQIVEALPADFNELSRVWENSVRASHDFFSEGYIRLLRPVVLERLLPEVERLFCTRDDAGKILGFIGITDRSIEMLFLLAEVRGKGIGKALLTHVVQEFGCNCVTVNEQNPKAKGFYEHCGFQVVGRSPVDGLGQPFPILVMHLN